MHPAGTLHEENRQTVHDRLCSFESITPHPTRSLSPRLRYQRDLGDKEGAEILGGSYGSIGEGLPSSSESGEHMFRGTNMRGNEQTAGKLQRPN